MSALAAAVLHAYPSGAIGAHSLSLSGDKKLGNAANLLENRYRFQNDHDKLEKRSEKWNE